MNLALHAVDLAEAIGAEDGLIASAVDAVRRRNELTPKARRFSEHNRQQALQNPTLSLPQYSNEWGWQSKITLEDPKVAGRRGALPVRSGG